MKKTNSSNNIDFKNVLILTSKSNSHYLNSENHGRITLEDIYKPQIVFRFLRHMPFFAKFSIGLWKKKVNESDIVIVFDSLLTKQSLYHIVKICRGKRLILFFRNKVTSKKRRWGFLKLTSLGVEIWSYNSLDCNKYGFKYHPDPPDDKLIESFKTKQPALFDMVFLGDNKGREKQLNNIVNICKTYNLISYLYVINGAKIPGNRCIGNKYMQYVKYLDLLCDSKAVLDIVNENNWGLTYRPFEAMFLRKKLITNYIDIINYDFYDPSNIFVIGKDDLEQIANFLNSSYKEIDSHIMDKYRTKYWLKNFNI